MALYFEAPEFVGFVGCVESGGLDLRGRKCGWVLFLKCMGIGKGIGLFTILVTPPPGMGEDGVLCIGY